MLYFHSWSAMPREETYINDVAKRMIVVQPWDNFGFNRQGCWWLGEGGDFFVPGLIDALIEDLRRQFPDSKGIHTCGRSMGGFGALFHGLRLLADGVYSEIPQSNLFRMYKDLSRFPPYIESVFGVHAEHPMGDLVAQYREAKEFPKRINLIHNRWDLNYENDEPFHQTMELINVLVEKRVDIYFEVPPTMGHRYMNPLTSIVDLLLA